MSFFKKAKKNTRGFTLIELSIVIAIIGLIVAGVTAGNSLVRQAQMRALLSDVDKYRTAMNAFKLQYNGLPGDIINAENFWPSATTNGNGDKMIAWDTEAFRVFQQMALAHLISGTYAADNLTQAPGTTLPITPITSGCIVVEQITAGDNAITFGGFHAGDGGVTICLAPLLTSSEVYNIDKKFDDAIPKKGKVIVRDDYAGSCLIGTDPNKTYNLGTAGNICNIVFLL